MDVVERYLRNVRAYLPGGARDDFVDELRENIRAQVEDREERAGHPLAEEELVAILRAHGHPLLVAGAYRADDRRLVLGREVIGPALFPFYRLALLGAAAITILVMAFGGVASLLEGGPPHPGLRTAVYNLTVLVAIATATFAGMEFWFRRTASTWDPRKLPASAAAKAPVTPTMRRVGAAFQLLATLVFLWFWVTVPFSTLLRASGLGHAIVLGPAWRLLHIGVTASTTVSIVSPALTLLQPSLHGFRWLVSLFSSGAFIAFASASIWKGDWVVPATALDPFAASLSRGINQGIVLALGMAIVITALATVFEVVRGAWREYRRAGVAS